MTPAYTCVLIAVILPFIWAAIAKRPFFKAQNYDNNAPRQLLETLEGAYKRANWAQQNAFEALPGFIGGVVIAQLAGVAPAMINTLAVIFIVARIAHGILYIKDMATARSLAWTVGIICVIGLYVAAIL
ncbi:MAG: hypothetical protein CMK32_15645 [Porticoccaceae bacterium]|nr:hypothetical protein [Porticoccaceae bacterium]